MVIKEYVRKNGNVIIEKKLKDEVVEIFIDSGSKNNYISEKAVRHIQLNTEECKPIKTVFGNGDVKKCRSLVVTGLNLKGVIIK